jgi:hypothetical protein
MIDFGCSLIREDDDEDWTILGALDVRRTRRLFSSPLNLRGCEISELTICSGPRSSGRELESESELVTEDVYKGLLGDGKVPDSRQAAEAFHHTIERLRDFGVSFLSYFPCIHVGL